MAYLSHHHERLCARILDLRRALEDVAQELEDMPADAFPVAENETLGRAVSHLNAATAALVPFT